MSGARRKYSKEFKLEAIRMSESGERSISEIEREQMDILLAVAQLKVPVNKLLVIVSNWLGLAGPLRVVSKPPKLEPPG